MSNCNLTRRTLLLTLLLLAAICRTPAAVVLWTNTAGGNWNQAGNWSPNTIPSSGDIVFITNAGTYTVTVDVSPTLNGLTVGAGGGSQTLANAGLTLTLNGASLIRTNGALIMNTTAVLTGSGDLTVTGSLDWMGGTMSGAGRTIVTSGGTLNISGSDYGKSLNRNLDIYGSGTLSGSGFSGGNGVILSVYGGANFDWIGGADLDWSGVGTRPTLQNSGTIRNTAGNGTTFCGFILNNNGLLRNQSGMLGLIGGGLSAGWFDAISNSVVSFWGGTHVMTNGVSFTSDSGGLFSASGGSLNFEVNFTFGPQLWLTLGGTVGGSRDVTFTGLLRWTGGRMVGPGRTIIANTGTLAIEGDSSSDQKLLRSLDLHGNLTISWPGFGSGDGAVLRVFPTGTIDWLGDAPVGWSGGDYLVLQNGGTIRKLAGAGTADCNFILNNDGLVRSQSGNLSFRLGGLSTGNFDAISNAVVSFSGGTHVMTNGVSFTASGGGFHRCDGGTLAFETPYTFNPQFNLDTTGKLAGSGDVVFTGPVNWIGGLMSGTGRTIVTNSGTLTIMNISGFSYVKELARDLDLYGTGSSGSYVGTAFKGGNGVVFNVHGGATFDFAGDDSGMGWTGVGGMATLRNSGTLRKTSGTANSANVVFILENTGLVRSQSGDLRFSSGGFSTGNFEAISNASVTFGGGTHVMTNEITFTASGGGLFRCDSGTLAFETPYTFNPQFNLDGSGTLGGSKDVNFTGLVNWTGGAMAGPGHTIVTNSGTLTISGSFYGKALARNLDLYGTGTYSGLAALNGGSGAVFSVFGGATFDFAGDAGLGWTGIGALATLQNAGTVRKTSGSGTANLNFAVTNTGDFRCQTGRINFQSTYRQNSGQTILSGGHYQAVVMDINGGLLTGAGNIAGNVRNAGQVTPGTGVGLMTITNTIPQTYTSTTNSLLTFQIGGLTPVTGHDVLRVNSNAVLAGTLSAVLANGYIPTPGNAYTVMTFSARSGVFTSFFFPDYDFAVRQSATNIVLIASNALPAVSLTGPSNVLVCSTFKLQTSATDLDGTVTNLSLFINTNLIASFADGAAHELSVSYDFPGPATFTARAKDEKGGIRDTNVSAWFYTLPLHSLNLGGKLTNGEFKFCMLGENGKNYDVLVNTNLHFPSNWTVVGVMQNTNGIWRFTDHGGTNPGPRFFRARQQ